MYIFSTVSDEDYLLLEVSSGEETMDKKPSD